MSSSVWAFGLFSSVFFHKQIPLYTFIIVPYADNCFISLLLKLKAQWLGTGRRVLTFSLKCQRGAMSSKLFAVAFPPGMYESSSISSPSQYFIGHLMSALLVCVQCYVVVIAFPRDFWLFSIISWVSLPPVCLLSYNCCLFHLPTFFDVVMASSFSITNKPGTQQQQKNVIEFFSFLPGVTFFSVVSW